MAPGRAAEALARGTLNATASGLFGTLVAHMLVCPCLLGGDDVWHRRPRRESAATANVNAVRLEEAHGKLQLGACNARDRLGYLLSSPACWAVESFECLRAASLLHPPRPLSHPTSIRSLSAHEVRRKGAATRCYVRVWRDMRPCSDGAKKLLGRLSARVYHKLSSQEATVSVPISP